MAKLAFFIAVAAKASILVRAGSCIGDFIQSSADCTPAMPAFMCGWNADCCVVEGKGCSLRPCQDFDADENSCIEKGCTYSEVERTPEPTEGSEPTLESTCIGSEPTLEPTHTPEPTEGSEPTLEPTQPPVTLDECYGSVSQSISSICNDLTSEMLCITVADVCKWASGQCVASCSSISSPQDCLQAGCSYQYGEKPKDDDPLYDTPNSKSSPGNGQNSSFTCVASLVLYAFYYNI